MSNKSRELALAGQLQKLGSTPTPQVVRWFWETVHAMDDDGKRRLLFFVTGSDRVPIKGLAHLNPPHVISK